MNGVWLRDVLARADKPENKWLERLAVYNAVESKRQIVENGKLTDGGKVLGTYHSGFAYNDANEYFMPWTYKAPEDLSLTYKNGTRYKIVTLTWTHNNSKQTDSICIQRKLEGGKFTTIRKLMLRENGVLTINDTVNNLSGLVTYKVRDYDMDKRSQSLDKNKTRDTEEVEVTLGAAQGIGGFQYGNLPLANLDEISVDYTEPFESATDVCVFMGTPTNKASTFYAGNIVNTKKNLFTYQFLPWQTNKGTISATIDMPFMALSQGNYKYGELDCEVRKVKSQKATTELWTDVTEVTFQQPFPEGVTPIVLTEILSPSYTTNEPITSLKTRIFDVTNTGFKFIIYPEDASGRKIVLAQNVCYLAITPGIGMVDEENDIMIAAGAGIDEQIYGSNTSFHDNNFYVSKYDEATSTTTNEQLYLYQPTLFTNLQTNNYPSLCMLKRTDITEKDEEGTQWTTGVKTRRILDHNLTVNGETIKTSTSDEAYRDNLGWVAIATRREGGSQPPVTAIYSISANTSDQMFQPSVINGRIYVNGTSHFEVYNAAGAKVSPHAVQPKGIYMVKVNGKSVKVMVR